MIPFFPESMIPGNGGAWTIWVKIEKMKKKIRINSWHIETKQRARPSQPSKCPPRHPTDKGAN